MQNFTFKTSKILLISGVLLLPNLNIILNPTTAAEWERFFDINTFQTIALFALSFFSEILPKKLDYFKKIKGLNAKRKVQRIKRGVKKTKKIRFEKEEKNVSEIVKIDETED